MCYFSIPRKEYELYIKCEKITPLNLPFIKAKVRKALEKLLHLTLEAEEGKKNKRRREIEGKSQSTEEGASSVEEEKRGPTLSVEDIVSLLESLDLVE